MANVTHWILITNDEKSAVTEVNHRILHEIYEDDQSVIGQLPPPPLFQLLQEWGWCIRGKNPETSVYGLTSVGLLAPIIDAIYQQNWEWPSAIQVMIQPENENKFRVFSLLQLPFVLAEVNLGRPVPMHYQPDWRD